MTKLLRPLALGAALAAGALAGTDYLLADEPPAKKLTPEEIKKLLSSTGGGIDPATPFRPGRAAANPMGDSKPDKEIEPVKVTNEIAKTDFAVKPKPLSDAVKKGLTFLVKSQQEDGGWNQGGGWRNATSGGRVEGKEVEDH